ncbi:MAG: hypothetical protein GC159_17370 [Phycisphaera sp.]|nr:hypothetical protein [Phycisphaera sp.]
MAEAKTKENWSHTASLMALIANAHRDPKKKPSPFKADDFTPKARSAPQEPKSDITILKDVFIKPRRQGSQP